MKSGWWARGLALSERTGDVRRVDAVVDAAAHERLARWRARYGPDGAERFATRLASLAIDERDLTLLLAETPESLAARVSRPAWADFVEASLPGAQPRPVPENRAWHAAFAVPLRPLVELACDELTSAAQRVAAEHLDLAAIADGFTERLGRRLVDIATRVLVLELNRRRGEGGLAGTDGAARFADFVRQLAGPAGMAEIYARYPVLARLLGEACQLAVASHLELLTRFAADRADIVDSLLDGVDPGRVVAIEAGQGDLHRRHRSVTVVTFADGRHVVHRPRDVEAYVRFTGIVGWLNTLEPSLALRTVAVVARAGYGWLEFIPARPLLDRRGAHRFYRRLGALLALLHALGASDFHCENLIACVDQPVLVDIETLFHPDVPMRDTPTEPAAVALAASVYRTLLLPTMLIGEHGVLDLSGLGGDIAGVSPLTEVDWESPGTDRMRLVRRPRAFTASSDNRPSFEGRVIDPGEHEAALLDGFRVGYDAIVRDRRGLVSRVVDCADIEVRVVFRHTRGYQILLEETTHPDLLRDGLDRDRTLDVLWTDSAADPVRSRLCPHEAEDLWAGDVPLFSGRPDTLDVYASAGRLLPGLLARTALRIALDRIAGMGEVDRRDQEWIISATLATRRSAAEQRHVAPPMPGPVAGIAAYPDRLLAAACAIGDQIMARSVADQARVNWLGLELVDDRQWLVLPMGAGLANGHLGVALFLAQLSERSGITRYGDVALRAVTSVPALLDLLDGRPEMVTAIGPGGLHGLGGIGYGLARLATLLDDAEVRAWAERAVAHAATAAAASDQPGWATGNAGCLAAMTAVHVELGLTAAARVATACADRLVAWPHRADGPGFADGPAGVGWALTRCSVHGDAGRSAVRLALSATPTDWSEPSGEARRPVQHSWCVGTAGLLVAATCLDGEVGLDRALTVLADRPVLGDLSLCHGELGVAEALTVLDAERFPDVSLVQRRRAGLVLDAIDRYGPRCGTPGGVPTPGLLHGLAGIGFGLLRLGFPEGVPSVLLLEPTPGTARGS
jgi:type 2 lantibiotic biosynthesis protein LanM